MAELVGGCLCGAIRYRAEAEPVMQGVCHCTHCQKQAGSAFSIVMAFPKGTVAIEGSPKSYDDSGDSGGRVERIFCPNCGSPLFTKADAAPDLFFIKAGTLDDPTAFAPAIHFYAQTRLPWVDTGGIPAFARMPEGESQGS